MAVKGFLDSGSCGARPVGVCVRQRIAEVEPPFRTNAILFRRHRRNIKTPVPGTYSRPVVSRGTVQPLNEIEKEYIIAVLELNGGNQTRTAEQLRIGLATIYRKL